jgi:hypothetical protein
MAPKTTKTSEMSETSACQLREKNALCASYANMPKSTADI